MKTAAYAAASAGAPLAPTTIERRACGPDDVVLEILFSGICHSDIHQARAEWGAATFPMVPGHEIVGRVIEIGANVTTLAVGELAGVGCMVDSCRTCAPCSEHHEQFCEHGTAWTYNSTLMDRTTPTYGGYAQHIVVAAHFAVKVPAGIEPAAAAPLLCAGITTYSPLVQWQCGAGMRVGVVGLGGLGHMGVKLAAAMGAEVTMLSTSASKAADASRLGAAHFALTTDRTAMKPLAGRFDLILDTVSGAHDYADYLRLLRPFGTMVIVGIPSAPVPVPAFALVNGNRRLAGSSIGGIAETHAMLEMCAQHELGADVEIIPASQINAAYERTIKGDVRYRFSIDASTFAS